MSKVASAAKAEAVRTSPVFDKCYRYQDAERARQAQLYSFFRVVESPQDPEVVVGGRRMIMLGSNNYLGLTNDPRVKEAAIGAIRQYGSGCAGSRFLNGTLDLHTRLEERLAEFMRQDAVVTFTTGYQVNLGTIACLVSNSGWCVSTITASSSVRVTGRLATIVPGCGPCGMPRGCSVSDASSTPRRLPKRPRT